MKFVYAVKKSKGRNVRISINRRGEVFLHIPAFVPEFLAKRFLISKYAWVEKNLEKVRKDLEMTRAEGFARRPSHKIIKREYLEKKEEARKLVIEKLAYWKKVYLERFSINFKWRKVSIKNSKTRWGSCSSKKNLNFSFRILFLNSQTQDYLIVHELCHLLEMNHSRNFWNLVSLAFSDYKSLRKSLKNGFVL